MRVVDKPKRDRNEDPEDKPEEVREIVVSYAVVCPGTVMVHPQHARAALSAVVGTLGLVVLALYAVLSPHRLRLFELVRRQLVVCRRRPSRHSHRKEVREPEHEVRKLEVDEGRRRVRRIPVHDGGGRDLQIQDKHAWNGNAHPGAAELNGHDKRVMCILRVFSPLLPLCPLLCSVISVVFIVSDS